MKDSRMNYALKAIARHSVPENINLWPNISARLERKSIMMTLRTRPLAAIVIALLTLLALSGAAYALGRVFGYIPDVGLVDQSTPLHVLPEPLTVQKQGITITVSKVVADSTRTFISYRVEGIPFVENEIPACITMPVMRLPDSTNLENISGGDGIPVVRNGNSMYYEAEYVYSAIPAGINKVTFVLPCILPKGGSPENWEIALNLSPAPEGYATPAVEIGATYSASVPKFETTPALEASTPEGIELSLFSTLTHMPNGSGLSLEKVLELTDSYILIGKFTDAGDLLGPLYMSTSSDFDYLPHIEDANGNPVSFKVREDARPDPDWDVAYYWAYEIQKPVAAPLKITVDHINIRKYNTAQFQFDTGDHPQSGQGWNLNLLAKLGASDFVVDSVIFLGNGYTFNISSENFPEGVSPDIEIVDSSLIPYEFDNISSTVDNTGNEAIITITLTTKNPPPIGNLTLNWGLDEFIPQPGPWSLIWTPSNTNP